MYQRIRVFFAARNVAEVDTPQLSTSGTTDVYIDSLTSEWLNQKLYWQTSPEFYMKRLIASGFPDCFQICKVFRNEPVGRHHSPEFSMLEWYRKGYKSEQMMAEISDLMMTLNPTWRDYQVVKKSYHSLFSPYGIDVTKDSALAVGEKVKQALGYDPNSRFTREEWLDCLFVSKIEPSFVDTPMLFIYDFPPSMASLAKTEVNAESRLVAKRFELYLHGIELCNGYEELTNADEQARRFDRDNSKRRYQKKPEVLADNLLVQAMRSGLPEMAGVAIGLDRLLMLIHNKKSISEVLSFPLKNPQSAVLHPDTLH